MTFIHTPSLSSTLKAAQSIAVIVILISAAVAGVELDANEDGRSAKLALRGEERELLQDYPSPDAIADLFLAILQNDTSALTGISQCQNCDISLLSAAVVTNNLQDAQAILDCNCTDVNTPIFWDAGRTVLFNATILANAEMVRLLLDAGADPRASDTFGFTPLHNAAELADISVLRALTNAGADANAKTTPALETPLHYAPLADAPLVVEVLVEAGADVNAVDSQGETPLHEAVAYGAEKVTRELLNQGADINAETLNGTKPIDFICACLTFQGLVNPCRPGQCTPGDILRVKEVLKEFLGESPSDQNTNEDADDYPYEDDSDEPEDPPTDDTDEYDYTGEDEPAEDDTGEDYTDEDETDEDTPPEEPSPEEPTIEESPVEEPISEEATVEDVPSDEGPLEEPPGEEAPLAESPLAALQAKLDKLDKDRKKREG